MSSEIAVRIVLFAGLLAHKILWEVLKKDRRGGWPSSPAAVLKVLFLAGLVLQTMTPTLFPIQPEPATVRAIGVLIFLAGLTVSIWARVELGNNWSDIEKGTLQAGHTLRDKGIYRYLRHPIYAGDLLLVFGFELALNSWLVLGLLVLTPTVVVLAMREEASLKRALPGYAAYCQRTRRFIPYII